MSTPIQLLIGATLLILMLSILIGVIRTGISPMPSSRAAIQTVLSYVQPSQSGAISELGAGWGSLAIPLARSHPRRQVIAYEVSTVPWLILRIRAAISATPNLTVKRQDFFDVDLSGSAAVVCYLYPGGMNRLSDKLKDELLPESLVVSNTFALPGWSAYQSTKLNDIHRTKIYQYRVY